MEAMACELPVVTTAVAGIPELVQNGITGLLANERDAESLAAALENLMGDKNLRDKLGRQARQKVHTDFNIQRSASELVSVFQRFDPCFGPRDEVECG
jgi:glycosyltransferase involved in cell wall biosynthesis